MATYQKYNNYVAQLLKAVHDAQAGGHVWRVYLSNIAPTASDTIKATGSATEFTPGGTGYAAGGEDVQNTLTDGTGTATVAGTKVVWTAATTTWNPFRYVVLYNDTATVLTDPLIAWWDYGVGGVTLGVGETFSVKFSASEGSGTIQAIT